MYKYERMHHFYVVFFLHIDENVECAHGTRSDVLFFPCCVVFILKSDRHFFPMSEVEKKKKKSWYSHKK